MSHTKILVSISYAALSLYINPLKLTGYKTGQNVKPHKPE